MAGKRLFCPKKVLVFWMQSIGSDKNMDKDRNCNFLLSLQIDSASLITLRKPNKVLKLIAVNLL